MARDSGRGKFEIFRAPDFKPTPTPEQVADLDMSAAVDAFDCSALLANHDESDVRHDVGEMVRAILPGARTTTLFDQKGADGMSLVHVWFGPNFPLFRHSHPSSGDCLYYIVAGQVIMGSQVLGPGDGFFVPNEMPYKYKAGPDGVEVLEFRAGGGIDGAPDNKLDESSLDAVRQITEGCRSQHDVWSAPLRVSAGPLVGSNGSGATA